jgi:exopolysaccharide biosynthesis polyprenyl glycosylphosphotransferase
VEPTPVIENLGSALPSRGAHATTGASELQVASAARRRDVARRRDTLYRRSLALADMVAVACAVGVAVAFGDEMRLTFAAASIPFVFVLIVKTMGLYDRDEQLLHKTTLDEVPALFALASLAVLLLWLADGLFVEGAWDRVQVLLAWMTLFSSMVCLRALARALAGSRVPIERCLLVGNAATAHYVRDKLAIGSSIKAELVGVVEPITALENGPSLPPVDLGLTVEAQQVERVILATGAISRDELLNTIRELKSLGVKVSVLPEASRITGSSAEMDRIHGMTLLGMRRFEFTRSSAVIKRSFDIFGSVCALTASAPVLAITAVAIKVSDRGPVFFRQLRVGMHGEHFQMVKFRSMVVGADEQKEGLRHLNEGDGVFKIVDDPRLTRVGRVIRRLHIDELPQLWNVLRGDMSLVGPRPLPLDEDIRIEGWHRRRLDLRPGITGPWQVLGSYRIPVREMVKLDYQYVAEWSLWSDVRILLLTLGHIARRRGQ